MGDWLGWGACVLRLCIMIKVEGSLGCLVVVVCVCVLERIN